MTDPNQTPSPSLRISSIRMSLEAIESLGRTLVALSRHLQSVEDHDLLDAPEVAAYGLTLEYALEEAVDLAGDATATLAEARATVLFAAESATEVA